MSPSFALFLALAGSSAGSFEGVLHMQMTIEGQTPIPSDVALRENGDSRTDTVIPTSGQPISVLQLHKGAKVTSTTLFHRDKKFIETDVTDTKPPTVDAFARATITKLAPENVAGQQCEHTQIVLPAGSTIDVWTTDALKIDVEKIRAANQGMAGNMMSALAAQGIKGLPLKIRAFVQGKAMTVETTAVTPKKLDAALFTVPKDYVKTTPEQLQPPPPTAPTPATKPAH
jgi:hypothetical protein